MPRIYRDYEVTHRPKPVPTSAWDWEFAHVDYDWSPDRPDLRNGTAPTLQAALQAIDRQIDELSDQ